MNQYGKAAQRVPGAKSRVIAAAAVLVVVAVGFIACGSIPDSQTTYTVVALPEETLGSMARPVITNIADELQWLAVQIACIGMYNSAETGDYAMGDPTDYYTPPDIRELLAETSGRRTKTDTFYGICFDYAQAAYNTITANQRHYEALGIRKGGWYIAGVFDNPNEIVLYDPSTEEAADLVLNGVYVKENSRKTVAAHGGATYHGWLWLYGKNGTIYWIDPTWTDNAGYVVWGVVENGREVQLKPSADLCKTVMPDDDAALAYVNRGNANKNEKRYDQAIEDFSAALRIDPNYAEAYFGRGFAYDNKGMYDRAIEDFTAALRINPNYTLARNNLELARKARGY